MHRGQPIRIAVIFEPGKRVRPVWFELNHKQYRITETTYHWQDHVGETRYLHYMVSVGEGLYELIYNSDDQLWVVQIHQTE